MASSSSSHQQNAFSKIEPLNKRRKIEQSSKLYDVFINHRGSDVKQTLAAQLHNSLKALGVKTFLDSEEELGDSFPSTIKTAISSASVHLAIFSETYAESAWCLAELVLMSQSKGKIIPVFYKVDPRDLRYIEKGVYAQAFLKHESNKRYLNKIEKWKETLQQVSYTAGYEFESADYGDCRDIVSAVEKEVQRTKRLHVAIYPVGLHKLVKDFERQCPDKLVQDFESQCGTKKANVVGIFGMGGVGKTTLSKELFNQKKSKYTRASFLFDVREAWSSGRLPSLQSKLLKDIFNEDHSFLSREEGTSLLKDRLERNSSSSFLIVLDDIDRVDQLESLLVMDILNRPGNNLVIITTREVGILASAGIDTGYHLKGLDREDGRELFCWHAFGQPHPSEGYADLVQGFVNFCGGLPLSLQLLGRRVSRRSQSYWQDALKEARKTLPADIKGRLRISFDSLDYEEKQIFMDIACFFIDKSITMAMTIWKGSGWSCQHAVETLREKCLIEENVSYLPSLEWEVKWKSRQDEFAFRMHDHVRDLGRELANDLNHPRRWWQPLHLKSLESKGFQNILTQTTGRCFHSFMDQSMDCQVTYFIGEPEDSPDVSLLWLQLDYQNRSQLDMNSDINPSIPAWICLQNLKCLRISGGRFRRLWQSDSQAPTGLKELQVRETFVKEFPDSLSQLIHLAELNLSGCEMLSSLPDGFGNLVSLRNLNLENCRALSVLPDSLSQLIHLAELNLSGCEMLSSLPDGFGNLVSLRNLNLENCRALRVLPDSLSQLIHLEELNLSGCEMLSSLPAGFENLINLRNLNLKYCKELSMLNLGNLTCLQSKNLELSKFPVNSEQSLHASFRELAEEEKEMFLDVACFLIGERKNTAIALWDGSGWNGLLGLERLVNKCLVELVDDPDYEGEKLIRMDDVIRDMGREIIVRHSPYRVWSPQQIVNMKKHSMKRNDIRGIKAILTGIEEWKSYGDEDMANTREEFLHLAPSLVGLKFLVIRGDYLNQVVAEVSRELLWLRCFQIGQRNLPACFSLKHMRVLELYEDSGWDHHLEQLWEEGSDAPLQLRELVIFDCPKFQRFPNSIGLLRHLKRIVLTNGKNVSGLPEEFCQLQSLEHLQLCACVMLSSLPVRFGDLRTLRHLDLSSCKMLRRLPVSFQYLILLEYLNLQECEQLTLMPEDFQNITKLKFLNLSWCQQLEELPSPITNQASLRELYLNNVKRLKELPINIGQLSSLRKMSIGSDLMTSLPNSLGDLSSLINLSIEYCPKLVFLPDSLGDLSSLTHLSILDCHNLKCLPDSLGFLSSLTILSIENCPELESLPNSLGELSSLIDLSILVCGNLKYLPDSLGDLSFLTFLSIEYCPKLESLPNSLGDLFLLTYLSILDCHNLKCLPDSLGYLSSLSILSIESCPELESLPNSLGNLSSLTYLSIQFCDNLKHLPDSLGHLCSLTNIKISNCPMLPDSFEQLTNLEKLNLSDCIVLPSLPAEPDNLTSGQNIDLKSDIQLSMLPADSKQSLQASYYELDKEEREMFLDAACFLIGEKKSKAVALWDGSGWSGMRGLQTIENKCLVELVDDPDYDGEKIMKMYDHIRDMGRQIASRQSPYRIWSPEQIIHMKKHSMERKLIRGILAAGAFVELKEHMHQAMGESSGRYQNLRFPTGLKILSVQENEFTEELASLSQDLVWLRWEGFPLRNLPSWLQLQNLSVLELHGANEMEELWQDQEHAPLQLRELTITGTWSASFERFPSSISYLKILKKIALLGDVGKEFGIKELPEEFCDLQSLEHLELRHCILLSSLPARFGDLRNLRHLDLCFCKGLRMLPVSFQQLTLLNYLDLSDCKRLLLQKDILENITNLKKLYLSGCLALQKLPHQITDQACLRELRLQHTHLKDLPSNIGQLSKLEVLTIGSPLLKRLPDSLGDLSSLKSLSITDCFALECLPKTLGNLVLLEHLCIEATGVRSLPEGFTQLANLRTLKISDCPLSELDFGSVCSFSLEKLTEINLSETLVTRISISEHCCPRLETLQLSKNDKLVVVENLPATVKKRKLSERETLDIKGIRALQIPLQLTISDCPRN